CRSHPSGHSGPGRCAPGAQCERPTGACSWSIVSVGLAHQARLFRLARLSPVIYVFTEPAVIDQPAREPQTLPRLWPLAVSPADVPESERDQALRLSQREAMAAQADGERRWPHDPEVDHDVQPPTFRRIDIRANDMNLVSTCPLFLLYHAAFDQN